MHDSDIPDAPYVGQATLSPGRQMVDGVGLTRRSVMAGGISATCLASAARSAAPRPRLAGRLGLQLYMVREQAEGDLRGTLERLHRIGYREIEASPLANHSADMFRAELDRAGLVCPSCHVGMEATLPGQLTLTDPSEVVRYAKTVGATNAVVAMFPFVKKLLEREDGPAVLADMAKLGVAITQIGQSFSAADWIAIAQELNSAGSRMAASGIRLGYHNHNIEFAAVEDGKTGLDLLMAHTDPRFVDFELDVGWAVAAGQDTASLLARHGARITQLHLKDLAPTPANTAMQINSAEFGAGVQPWDALTRAIAGSSVQHVYVEQEAPFATSAMASAAAAYALVQPLLLRNGA